MQSAGREDADVRMLGDGRPFLIEFINPKCVNFTEKQLQEIQNQIFTNSKGAVTVKYLQKASKYTPPLEILTKIPGPNLQN